MFLEKVEKATCDMVTVIVSVKIRRWTALKEDTIQPFKPDSSFIIVIIIINIIIISFMQGIYTYIPETNCVPREYSVAAILLLLFMVLIIIKYGCLCHRPFLPGTSLEPAVIPTAHASSFTLQHFPYCVRCSKYSCLL